MPLSPPTALGGSTLSLIMQNKRPMERSPWAFILPPTPNPLINDLKPTHCAGWVSSFYLPFIWGSLFKDRVVAMGKPHCNYSIWTFCSTVLKENPVPWACRRGSFRTAFLFCRKRIRLSMQCFPSVFFRVRPWLCLMLMLGLPSAAMLLLLLPFYLPSCKNKRPKERSPWAFTFSQLHQFYLMPSRNLAFKL